jgi:F0F1-type ATP synthase assembly protein I
MNDPTKHGHESKVPPSGADKTREAVRGAGVYMGLAMEFIGYLAVTGTMGYFADRWWGGGKGWFFFGGFTLGMILGIFKLVRRIPEFTGPGPTGRKRERPKTSDERMKEVRSGFDDVEKRLNSLSRGTEKGKGKGDE